MGAGAERLIVWHRLASRGRDELSHPRAITSWARSARARMVAAGGEALATISGTVVAAFDPGEIADVLEAALELIEEGERRELAVSIGVALGLVHEGAGRAIDVAEALAARAQAGEVVLDPPARERAEGLFLFGRAVSTGVGGPRGAAIDRVHRLDTIGDAIARLRRPPIAPITAERIDELEALLRVEPLPAIVLRGPVGAGSGELVAAAAARANARSVIVVGGGAGGIAPLASLRYALARTLGPDDAVVATCGDDAAGRTAGRVLRAVLRGGLPPRDAVRDALVTLFTRLGAGRRVWMFLTPLAIVDGATLEVLLAARSAPVVIVARCPLDAKLPSGIADSVRELTLPPLRASDARSIAHAVLGETTDGELARRIAVLGGETPLGVLEVARALVASGDLVFSGERFVWRGAPRGGVSAIPLEEVIDERLSRLEDEPRRMLEALCVAPDGAARDLVEAVAARDGVGEKARARALDRLAREGWLELEEAPSSKAPLAPRALARPRPSSAFVRRFVVQGMPPARAAELHRFVAEALIERGADDAAAPSLRAELAHYEIEGGIEDRGADRLIEVGRLALDAGYRRAASRIAALLARVGAPDARALARAVATQPPSVSGAETSWDDEDYAPASAEHALDALASTGPHALPQSAPEPPTEEVSLPGSGSDRSPSFATAAEDAVRSHDLEALERLLQRAVAAGSDMAAISRFRALADLLRGDVGAARVSLAKARGYRGEGIDQDPRQPLAEAAVSLHAGELGTAVRLGLRALALARRRADRKGETAALKMLATCYRALGRADDAATLEAVGGA